jgi:hypothetical protein
MAATHDECLSADELQAILSIWRLPTSPDSPLCGLPAAAVPVNEAALRARGLMAEPWGQALVALQHPKGCLRIIRPLPERTLVQAFYRSYGDGLIGCWPEDGRMRIGFTYLEDDQVRRCSEALMADLVRATDPLKADLSVEGLAVLTAAVDVLRWRLLQGIIERTVESPSSFGLKELEHMYADGLVHQDARWVVTLLRFLMPMSIELPKELPRLGIQELARLGLVQLQGEQWRPGDAIYRLAAWWKTPLPALAHEVIVLAEDGLSHYRYLIAIRGDGPVWLLLFWLTEDGRPKITLQSTSGAGYRRVLRGILHPLYEGLPLTAAPIATAIPQPEEQPLQPARFCSRCGAKAQPEASFCSHCGDRLMA